MTQGVKVIAIDGPSGSGKSTIAKEVAKKYNLTYIDTGAMFRAIAFSLKDLGIDTTTTILNAFDEKRVKEKLDSLVFKYAPTPDVLIEINGEDLTTKIREHEVSRLASLYSRYGVVREYLKKIQREIAKEKPSLLDGRDIGTVIFPDAPLKFFITASSKVRAERRYKQLLSFDPKNKDLYSLEQIEKDIIVRDEEDMNRKEAPLKKADDAIYIETDNLNIEAVLNIIDSHYKKVEHLLC